MMEAICSSETSLLSIAARRHIPEDGILQQETITGRWGDNYDGTVTTANGVRTGKVRYGLLIIE
jgi:hypothetical protein